MERPGNIQTALGGMGAVQRDQAAHGSSRLFTGERLEQQLEAWLRGRMPEVSSIVPDGQPVTFRHVSQLLEQGRLYRPPLLLTATNLSRKRIEIIRSIDPRYADLSLVKPKHFFLSLGTMLSSGTRNELEERLAQNSPRSLIIKQPYSRTAGPDDVLDVSALNQKKMEEMVSRGRAFADSDLRARGSPASVVTGPKVTERVTRQLEDMVRKCDLIFNSHCL